MRPEPCYIPRLAEYNPELREVLGKILDYIETLEYTRVRCLFEWVILYNKFIVTLQDEKELVYIMQGTGTTLKSALEDLYNNCVDPLGKSREEE